MNFVFQNACFFSPFCTQTVALWDLRNLKLKLHSFESHKDEIFQVRETNADIFKKEDLDMQEGMLMLYPTVLIEMFCVPMLISVGIGVVYQACS